MQVFKLYWKLLRSNLRGFIIYMCIFPGLLFGVIIPNQTKETSSAYSDMTCSYAVFDEDQSRLSHAVCEYLDKNHNQVTLANYEKETVQDELFYQNIDALIVFHRGFEENLMNKNGKEYVEIFMIPGTMSGSLFEQDYNGYVSKVAAYVLGGSDMEEAISEAEKICGIEMPVSFLKGDNKAGRSTEYVFFVYLVWIFIAMCIQSVSPVLGIMDRKEVKNRVYFSSYRFSAYNMEILLASIVTGVMLCAVFLLLAVATIHVNLFSLQGLLLVLNMLCIMVVAMAFTLLASRITSNGQVLSVLSNIISLGMAFLCGVFVPMEYLGEGVIRFAHFLPAYWYVHTLELITDHAAGHMAEIFSSMGIELLFGGAIIAVSFVIAKRKAA